MGSSLYQFLTCLRRIYVVDNKDDSDDSLENVDVTKVTGVPDGSLAPTESCYDSTCQ